jgi:hypothetical protein
MGMGIWSRFSKRNTNCTQRIRKARATPLISLRDTEDRRQAYYDGAIMGFVQDVRYATRRLIQSRLLTLTAITTLALGAGVNAGVISVVKSVLLESLPYGDAQQLVMIWIKNPTQGFDKDITSYPRYLDWKRQSTLTADMAAFSGSRMNLTGVDEPEQLRGAQVTANFFRVLQAQPLIGSGFEDGDDDAARDR